MLNIPNVNIVSTIKNGQVIAWLPNFSCNGTPALLVILRSTVSGESLYIVPISPNLPQILDSDASLPEGTVQIVPEYYGFFSYDAVVVENFRGDGCSAIMLHETAQMPLRFEMDYMFFIHGGQNLPPILNVTELFEPSSQYGWVYKGIEGNSFLFGSSGYFSSTKSHDITICNGQYIPSSHELRSLIYNNPNPFPLIINASWVANNNDVGFNMRDFGCIPFSSDKIQSLGLYSDLNYGDSFVNDFSIVSPIARGTFNGEITNTSIPISYISTASVKIDGHDDDDYGNDDMQKPGGFNIVTGDFNGNGILDIAASYISNDSRYCGVIYILYDVKGGFDDIDLRTLTPPEGSVIYGAQPGSCHRYRTQQYDLELSTADVNGDGYTDLLVSNGAIVVQADESHSYLASIVFGSPQGLPNGLILKNLTPEQGLNFNSTVPSNDMTNCALYALGRIDESGKDAFVYNSCLDSNQSIMIMP
jgi:hypothetical protein